MCILQLVYVKYGGLILEKLILLDVFVIISVKNNFGFVKEELLREIFIDLRKLLLLRWDNFIFIELQEKMELICW